jgi:O-antigen ligase
MRRPWLAFLLLFGLFSVAGPYDWNNRVDKEGAEGNLKAALSGTSAGIEEGSSSRRLAVIGLAIFAVAITARRRRKERRGLLTEPAVAGLGGDRAVIVPLVAFVLFAAASALWADDPGLVARRVVVFLCVSFAAYAVARAWTLPDILSFTVLACLTTLCVSLGLEIMRGQFHPLDGGYRLMGLTHPNNHAQECAALIFASLAAMRLVPERRRFYALTTIAGFGFIMLTRSRTSALAVVAALGFAALYIMPKRRVFGVALVMAAVALIIGVFGPDVLDSAKHALLFGRQEAGADVGTLTGRTELWSELMTYVAARPIVGYGFEGFWGPMHTASVALSMGWVVPHAHNGYIEMLLDLGGVGLVLFVVALLSGLLHAQRRLRAFPGDTEALFALTLLVWVMVAMVSEKVLPQTDYAAFLTMVVLAREAVAWPILAKQRPIRAYARTVSA